MKNRKSHDWSRREFLEGLALVGTAAVLGWQPDQHTDWSFLNGLKKEFRLTAW